MLLKSLFLSEIKREIGKYQVNEKEVFTEEEIKKLPLPVQNYFYYTGLAGKNKPINCKIIWKEAFLKNKNDGKFIKIKCSQFNSLPEPARIVYMKARLFNLIPFEGRDKCQDGKGNMLIKILKGITVADEKTVEMDISALVTVLAETFLLPSYAVQKYIEWYPVDLYKAKAILRYGGVKASGVFEFNNKGEFIAFSSDDRYQSKGSNCYFRTKWSVTASNYIDKNGYKFPTFVTAAWIQKDADFIYFKGFIDNIIYDIKSF